MDGQSPLLKLPAEKQSSGPRRSGWQLPAVLAILGICCFFLLDSFVGQTFARQKLGGELADLLGAAEHFGTPYGQLLILISLFLVLETRERRLVRVFAGACAGGIMADVIKLLIARTRPRSMDFQAHSLAESFTGLFPFGAGGSAAQSFPSAHTACAFAFAALLSWLYPRGRNWFITLALLTGLQRICSGSHFPSDVCFGAAVGWLTGQALIHWQPANRTFQRLEQPAPITEPQPRQAA